MKKFSLQSESRASFARSLMKVTIFTCKGIFFSNLLHVKVLPPKNGNTHFKKIYFFSGSVVQLLPSPLMINLMAFSFFLDSTGELTIFAISF